MKPRIILLLAALSFVVSGCEMGSLMGLPTPPPAPVPCGSMYTPERCDAMLVAASITEGIDPADVVRIDILPLPTADEGGLRPAHHRDPRVRP